MCRYGYERNGQNRAKSTTQARDLERVSKAGAGKHFSRIDPNFVQMVLEESIVVNFSPWNYFEEKARVVLELYKLTSLVLV